jgi:hypothetical protein
MSLRPETIRQSLNPEFPGRQAERLGYLFERQAENAIGSESVGVSTGGTATQETSKATAVTLNAPSGRITMHNAELAAGAEVAFTLNNTSIAATDVIVVNVAATGTVGSYLVGIGAVANGSCSIVLSNCSAGALSQAVALNFVVIKGA